MSQCKIFLENYVGIYYTGSEIRGRLECYFDEDISIRGIKIRLKCKEHNEWMVTETYYDSNNRSRTRSVLATGDREVLCVENILLGSGSGRYNINRGRHVYPFTFHLSENIPSTFHGTYGSVRYELKGIVDRPMSFNYNDKFIIIVMAPIIFNTLSSDLQEPVAYSDEKTICCCCCRRGNITMDVELPKTGFAPGENVPFKVTVTNLSNSNMKTLKVKFKKIIKYTVRSPRQQSREDNEEFINFTEHGVGAHGKHTYDLQLQIPDNLEVPNFSHCNLFEVSYKLVVSCNMPTCTLDLNVEIWASMGHIQYRGQFETNILPGFIPSQSDPGGDYASPSVSGYPPPPVSGSSYPLPPPYPSSSLDKSVFPSGPPTDSTSSIANAPFENNPQTSETTGAPSAPPQLPDMPPPPYNQIQNLPPYRPQ